ncbi:MAG: hypothetical protein ACM3S1_14010 [Hyphomicrobiales bacterium]
MLLMKGCEKCHGALLLEQDGPMNDLVCLQCGFRPPDGPLRAERLIRLARIRKAKAAAADARRWPVEAATAAG